MPHKHKRKRGADEADFELPPSQRARSLSTGPAKSTKRGTTKGPPPSKKRDGGRAKNDDAPRAFRRIMAAAHGKKGRSGLDDGGGGERDTPAADAQSPRIRPGEDMRSFAARVDAALPVSGLARKTTVKDGKDEFGFKVQRTRKERKMHKLYDQWRAEERNIKEKREEELELAAERELNDDNPSGTSLSAYVAGAEEIPGQKKSKRRRRQDDDEDPWDELKRRRAEAKIGLNEVAKAPPELHRKKTKHLKVGGAAVNVANVPKSAGSLRRREELQTARDEVVEAYRKIREHEQAKLDAKR